jgi:HEPN domain-containing protein
MTDDGDASRVLIDLARDDEFAARSLLDIPGVSDAILGFHAQQAVEKSLKAALAHTGIEFPFSHDLDGLVDLCRKHGIDVPTELDGVDQLTPFGVGLRYGASSPASLNRDQALGWATCAIAWAEGILDTPKSSVESATDASGSS